MTKQALERDEVLYRANTENPPFLDTGEASYGLFTDPRGCSVERKFGRSENEACESLLENLRSNSKRTVHSIHSVTSGECLDLDTFPHQIGKRNCHAEIHESQQVKEISLKKAVLLARIAKVIIKY